MNIKKTVKKSLYGGMILSAFAAVTMSLTPAIAHVPARAAEHEIIGGNYFLSDYDTRSDVLEAGKKFNREIAVEGTVLLKNAEMPMGGKALPFITEKNISLFGKNVPGGGVAMGLKNAGFKINPVLQQFYAGSVSGIGAPGHPGNGVVVSGLPTGEADITKFSDPTDSIAEYNDAAIVTFYRTSGEGFDIPRTMGQVDGSYKIFGEDEMQPVTGARAYDDHQLQLDAYETATLKYCAEHFDKVIVILNSPAPMECGFLDDPDHYAYSDKIVGALWTNLSNADAWLGVADILIGEANPSARLPDTYARDYKADPTWNNLGNNFMEDYEKNGSTVYAKGNQYANENMRGTGGNGGGGYYSNYVYYKEGIYSGYRYWETRGYTEGLDTQWTGTETDVLPRFAHGANEAIHYYSKTNAADKAKQDALDGKTWDNWYDAHVVYPFGYGLSYTSFEWTLDEINETLDTDGKITAKVTVKNTGDVAGKDVVQLYYNAPYIMGGIEKAHVKLGAYAKTELLEPQQSETVVLEFAVRDMASYDYNDANKNGFKGYELDAGKYNIYIGKNAHCWAEQNVITKQYELASGVKYEFETNGTKVENRFDKMSEQLLHEDRYPEDDQSDEKDKYMTRSDWAGTYPTLSYRLTAEQWIIDGLKEYNDVAEAPFGTVYPEDKPTDPWYNDVMPKTGVKYDTPIKLQELFGLDYEDPKWDEFLDQLTVAQLTEIALRGAYKSGINVPELGITEVYNEDAPVCVLIPGAETNVYLPNDIVTAATFNTELAYRRGLLLGNMSLWGSGDASTRVPGWYAPAVNIHRSPFGGRVGEYFSEDGVLAGMQSAQIVLGAQEKGMWCYVKHFAVNSQETNRCGLITWADEQTMREVYFKPFELCVKVGETMGIMSSLNRFGPRWAGGSYELLTNVLRDEWGFRGNVVTDSFASWSNADIMIRAGGSLALGYGTLHGSKDSATTVNCLRNCAHDILYTHANSMALNAGETPTVPKKMRNFKSKTLSVAMVDVEYNESIADCLELNTMYYPDVNISDVTFFVAEGSMLPRGLTLSPDGTISGKPKTESRLSTVIVATLGNETVSRTFTITVAGAGGVIVYNTHETELNAIIGSALNASVAKASIYDPYATPDEVANFPPIAYTLANGSILPEGLVLNDNGYITGVPTKECRDYAFTVIASAIGYRDVDCTFTITVLHALSYAGKTLQNGVYGKTYVASVADAVCGGEVKYALKDGSELPKGLKLTENGMIAGIPAEAVSKTFTVVASNPYADPVEAEFTLNVDLRFDSTTELPYGKVGEAYLGSVGTAQGSFDISYEIVSGSLPSGIKLSSDGTLSGKPEASGAYTFTVRASDGELTDDITLTMFVDNGGGLTTVIKGGADSGATMGAVGIALGAVGLACGGAALALVLVSMRKKKKQTVGAEQADDGASQGEK